MHNSLTSPTLTNCLFSENTASRGGGMYNKSSAPVVTDCTFVSNSVSIEGGGMYNYSSYDSDPYSSPMLNNCIFADNSAKGPGGGIYNERTLSTLTNCVIIDNSASQGGGLLNSRSSLQVTNCTLTGNSANKEGGGIFTSNDTSTTLTNSIIWDNSAPAGPEVYNPPSESWIPTFYHSNIDGSGNSGDQWNSLLGTDGGGNIDADPRFIDATNPAGPDDVWMTSDDGLLLHPISPCIDAGTDDGAPETDILGYSRDATPNLGAYELLGINAASAWFHYP